MEEGNVTSFKFSIVCLGFAVLRLTQFLNQPDLELLEQILGISFLGTIYSQPLESQVNGLAGNINANPLAMVPLGHH
jgi:hypothetical protein